MKSFITYLGIKSKEAGHRLSMGELREVISSDISEYNRINEDLQNFYDKTFKYEEMQKVLEDTRKLELAL